MTHRQFTTWQAWQALQWNQPDRHDYYQMQTATEMRRLRMKNPQAVQVTNLKIRFREPGEKTASTPEERRQVAQAAQNLWAGRLGGVMATTISRETAEELERLPAEEAMRRRRAIAEQAQQAKQS